MKTGTLGLSIEWYKFFRPLVNFKKWTNTSSLSLKKSWKVVEKKRPKLERKNGKIRRTFLKFRPPKSNPIELKFGIYTDEIFRELTEKTENC